MTDLTQFAHLIDESPESPWTALGVIADYCEERGEYLLAQAFRWLVENDKKPSMTYELGWWHWHWGQRWQSYLEIERFLEKPWDGTGEKLRPWYRAHKSPSAAYLAAALELSKHPSILTSRPTAAKETET